LQYRHGFLRMVYCAYLSVANHMVNRIPFNSVRCFFYRWVYFVKIGRGSAIHMGVRMHRPRWISIGHHTLINPQCTLDGRRRLTIGNNVDIAAQTAIFTLGHDLQDPAYEVIGKAVVIEDYACIFSRATILPGVRIGQGAAVAAGSVVTRDVEPYTIVAGNPARKIGERNRDLSYTLRHGFYFH